MTKTNHIYALKWTKEDGSCREYQYNLPKGCILGAWHHIDGSLQICDNGFHATSLFGVNEWRGIGGYDYKNSYSCPVGRLWIVELGGDIVSNEADHKLAASAIRFIKELKYETRYDKDEGEYLVRINDVKSKILETKYTVLSSIYQLSGYYNIANEFNKISKAVTFIK